MQAQSGGTGDLLPGLCALVQQWLQDITTMQFRAKPDVALCPLDLWFDNPRVALYLKVRRPGHTVHMAYVGAGNKSTGFNGTALDIIEHTHSADMPCRQQH